MRFGGRMPAQAPLRNAARAEATARLMSSVSPAATRASSLPVAGIDGVERGARGGIEVAPVDERLRAELERPGALVPGNLIGFCVHDLSFSLVQKVGGVQALMISHASRPTLRKRCGSWLAK